MKALNVSEKVALPLIATGMSYYTEEVDRFVILIPQELGIVLKFEKFKSGDENDLMWVDMYLGKSMPFLGFDKQEFVITTN